MIREDEGERKAGCRSCGQSDQEGLSREVVFAMKPEV